MITFALFNLYTKLQLHRKENYTSLQKLETANYNHLKELLCINILFQLENVTWFKL